jgi:hypothetical protein
METKIKLSKEQRQAYQSVKVAYLKFRDSELNYKQLFNNLKAIDKKEGNNFYANFEKKLSNYGKIKALTTTLSDNQVISLFNKQGRTTLDFVFNNMVIKLDKHIELGGRIDIEKNAKLDSIISNTLDLSVNTYINFENLLLVLCSGSISIKKTFNRSTIKTIAKLRPQLFVNNIAKVKNEYFDADSELLTKFIKSLKFNSLNDFKTAVKSHPNMTIAEILEARASVQKPKSEAKVKSASKSLGA